MEVLSNIGQWAADGRRMRWFFFAQASVCVMAARMSVVDVCDAAVTRRSGAVAVFHRAISNDQNDSFGS